MQENENSFNLDLIDLRGSEGVLDYCSKTNIVIYSVGSILVYWELVKDKKLYINYHESTIAAIKISHLGNYFISIDKNKSPNIIFWEIPSLNILYQSKLSVNFRSDKDKFPEETKFLRENNILSHFNMKSEISKNSGFIINDIFIEFFQTNYICVLINIEQYESNPFQDNAIVDSNLYKNNFGSYKSKRLIKQIFYLFEMINSIQIKFFRVIDNENHCYGIKSFLNGNLVSIEEKVLKFWKIDHNQNNIKLKTKIHIKQKLVKNQFQLCEYLKMIIILNENYSCLILDETGVFLLSINSDFRPLTKNNRFQAYESEKNLIPTNTEVFISINVFNETLFLSTNRGNALVYNLNGFKFVGKIEYDHENKKKYLLNNYEKIKSKFDLAVENLDLNNKLEKNISCGFFIRNLFIDEDSDLVLANYSDNSITIFSYSKSIKNKNVLLGSKYRKAKNSLNFNSFNKNQFNLELSGNMNDNQKNFFLFSHFERITDICWLNNNYKSFITSSTDQSLMLWNYRGDKWVNHYFDLLKIFDKNLNNFENQVSNQFAQINLEKTKTPNCFEDEEKETKIYDDTLFKIKYFINVVISHPKRNDLLIAGDNKGNIYQFDCDLKEHPKKFVVGNFSINSLSFSRNGNYLAVGFSTGNVILVDYTNNCKFCSIVEEYNNDESEIKESNKKNMLLSYCYIFKKYTYIDNIPNDNPLSNKLNSILHNSETENSTIKIISMNSYKTLRVQLIKKSLLSNNINSYNNMNRNLGFSHLDKKEFNSNIPNNYFNSTIKNFNFNYRIKKIEMHISEEYMIILFDNNNILINRIESNIISGVITLNNQYLEFYDIKADPSGLYLAVLSDAFANQEYLDLKSFEIENENEALKNENRNSEFNQTSNKHFNSVDKNRSINFKSNGLRSVENKRSDNNLYKSTTKNEFHDRENTKLTSYELSSIRDNIRKRSSIIVYEIGTGNFVFILKNLFVISHYKFSNDGRFLCLTSESGCVSVWNTSGEIRENIFSILEEIKINPNFWESFRINFCLENAEKFNFFQKIEKEETNKNYDLIRKIEEKKQEKNLKRFGNENYQKENIKSKRNGVNTSLNFSPDNDKKSIEKQTLSKDEEKTDLNNNKITTNNPSNLNNAKFTTTCNYDSSYKSLYLNYENTNYNDRNSVREIHASSSNLDENLINKSSRGKIFSNFPFTSSEDKKIKFKKSNASIEKNSNFSPKGGKPNMLYSSSNLYKKSFQVEEFVNMDNRASKRKLKSIDRENHFINNYNKKDENNSHIKNNEIKSSNDYLINFSKEKMMVNVFPDPEDIDDLDNENLANQGKTVSPPLVNQIDLNPSSDNIITEEFFENSKVKGSTADQIEYFDNYINNFEKNFIKKLDIMDKSNSKISRNAPSNSDFSKNRSYLKDSIDN